MWATTPRELAMAADSLAPSATNPPGREQLRDLMHRFPDH
ncbi:MAG: phage tail assembly chaperone [Hyphomicrobiaceae bacterium]